MLRSNLLQGRELTHLPTPTGAPLICSRCRNAKDLLGQSLAELQAQFGEILGRSQQEKEASQARERALQKELTSQQAKLEEAQEKYRLSCNRAAEAKVRGMRVAHRRATGGHALFPGQLWSVDLPQSQTCILSWIDEVTAWQSQLGNRMLLLRNAVGIASRQWCQQSGQRGVTPLVAKTSEALRTVEYQLERQVQAERKETSCAEFRHSVISTSD